MRERETMQSMNETQENREDEVQILADQDETTREFTAEDPDEREPGLDVGAFARGEVDVAEQVSRTTKAMDHITGRGEKKAAPTT